MNRLSPAILSAVIAAGGVPIRAQMVVTPSVSTQQLNQDIAKQRQFIRNEKRDIRKDRGLERSELSELRANERAAVKVVRGDKSLTSEQRAAKLKAVNDDYESKYNAIRKNHEDTRKKDLKKIEDAKAQIDKDRRERHASIAK